MCVYTFPVFSSTSPVYFNLSNLLLPLCSPIWPPLCLLSTSLRLSRYSNVAKGESRPVCSRPAAAASPFIIDL